MNAATIVNSFRKSADPNPLQKYERRFDRLSIEERRRAVENILAGDDPETAIRDARQPLKSCTCDLADGVCLCEWEEK